jgi:ATP-dependent RNA helicase RhlE
MGAVCYGHGYVARKTNNNLMHFNELGLDRPLEQALARLGYTTPTPIQSAAIPPALERHDVLGTAQTGTGKTVAFLVPSLHHLIQGKAERAPRMVVLAPTRELALQIAAETDELVRFSALRTVVVYGGAPLKPQAERLRKGIDVIIATPGRLLDHLERGNVAFDHVEILVLDEADRMLDMGFLPDIDAIVRRMPAERQTLLFSATMPQTILGLSRRYLSDPIRVEIATARPPDSIRQELYPVPKHLKLGLMLQLLRGDGVDSALVFTRTRQEADLVSARLLEAGESVGVIHGEFQQKDRVRALEAFRSGATRILVATNVAARGLDIDGISHVINYDVPEEAEDYVHRIGRTARVDASGVAWTLVTPDDEPLISGIEYLLGKKIDRARLDGFDYDVPMPDWARPSAKAILRGMNRNQSSIARWKALTR